MKMSQVCRPGSLGNQLDFLLGMFFFYCLTCSLATCNFFIFGLAVTVIPNIGYIALVINNTVLL